MEGLSVGRILERCFGVKNLKISWKLLTTFGIIIVFFCAVVILSVVGLNNSVAEFTDFYENEHEVTNQSSELRRSVSSAIKCVGFTILIDDTNKINEYKSTAESEIETISKGLAYMQENFEGDQALVTQAQNLLASGKQFRSQIMDLALQNRNDEGSEIFFNNYEPIMMELQDVLASINGEAGTIAEKNYQDSKQMVQMITIALIVLAIIALIVTLILSSAITRGLTSPILEIEMVAAKICDGDLDAKITYESKDELGILSEKMRSLTATMKKIISDVDYLLGEMADGNFNVRSRARDSYVGAFSSLLAAVRRINSGLSNTLGQINQASDQVASGGDQVSSGAQALSQGATEQASSVEELAATITEISRQVKENSENAAQAGAKANEVGREMMESNQQMKAMIDAMGEISHASSEIGKIIKTIEDIAFQTNILALNAAVEAARAGAAGKGFAVVADEVRNLANKSQEASKNTSALIENSIRAVENGTQIADKTAQSLLAAVEGAKDVAATVDKISAATTEQAEAIDQVTQGIDQISAVVQTNSATSQQSAAASEELSSQAQMLKNLVGRFRLRDDDTYGSAVPAASSGESESDYSSFMNVSSKY